MVVNSNLEVGFGANSLMKEFYRPIEGVHECLNLKNDARIGVGSQKRIIGSVSMPPFVDNRLSIAISRHSRLWTVRMDDAASGTP